MKEEKKLRRLKIRIEYDGTNYAGFQKQKDIPTIQQAIEQALYDFCGQEIKITPAGRTDAGVHARGQIAHFDLPKPSGDKKGAMNETPANIAKALNAHLLDHPVRILSCEEVSEDFHARFGAKLKRYRYSYYTRKAAPTLERHMFWWLKHPLDIKKMEAAARHLIGHHDFSTFRDSGCQAKSPLRTIDDICLNSHDHFDGRLITLDIMAQSFLHHQVRNIAGTLKLVGEGKWQSEDVKTALEAKDRTKGGPTAPAQGLMLISIDYK